MIVCHCAVVSHHEVRDAIADGATNVCALAQVCGTSQRCGGCLPAIRSELAQHGLPTDDHLDHRSIRAFVEGRTPAAASVS